MSDRQANLAKIHIGAKALGLDDVQYRELLFSITGKRSSKDMDPGEHRRVIKEMEELGFQGGPPTSPGKTKGGDSTCKDGPFNTGRATYIRLIKKLWHQRSRGMDEQASLRRWVFKRYHVQDLEELRVDQLKDAWERMRAW